MGYLLNWLAGDAVELINNYLPVYQLDQSVVTGVSQACTNIKDFLEAVNFIVPLPDIMLIISVDIGIRLFKVAMFCGNWIIRRIADIIP